MEDNKIQKRFVPEDIVNAVGIEKAELAAIKATDMADKLDRTNHWGQEPGHVFCASTWSSAK
ncbi:MAG: hypothetical protein CMM58_12460 [Rhodospirillaceae bacterium]|mgnify:CR=1 FL=1|nr:hypothetical protein [Rhodospirillaceae bacterium]|tara:strand:- start:528 stop:713 length:186 start_codon:yes stop_codon:yes gene_type:complete